MNQPVRNEASFRDPGGTVFIQNGIIYRQVNNSYQSHYEHLMHSGLYQLLTESGELIPHSQENVPPLSPEESFCVIAPKKVPFVSYPYEWCFSQLKDAALCTLSILQKSINYGMILKDCSAFNIQFIDNEPIFIDTLSFAKYQEGTPWTGYRQFCQHFLAPLVLMSRKDLRFGLLFRNHIDGIPLDFASKILNPGTWLLPSLLVHIHLHAMLQVKFAGDKSGKMDKKISRNSLCGIFDNLRSTIQRLKIASPRTDPWSNYYSTFSYTPEAFSQKKKVISGMLGITEPATLWDLGSNDGTFSRIAQEKGIEVTSFDNDHSVVEKNYRVNKTSGIKGILPLLLDLTNPSPSCGWAHAERSSLLQRGPIDCILALALIHHLSISNNVPFSLVADFLAKLCSALIIEYVPYEDPQVQGLLRTRTDKFDWYTQENFEKTFSERFKIVESVTLCDCSRTIYLMQKI